MVLGLLHFDFAFDADSPQQFGQLSKCIWPY